MISHISQTSNGAFLSKATMNRSNNRIGFSRKMRNFICAMLIAFGLFGVNALNAKEWQVGTAQKQGAFVGAELAFAPWWGVSAIGGYQWYFYDKPHFHLGLRLTGRLSYSFNSTNYALYDYTSHSIGIRVVPAFIWDFLNIDEHTLGWHFAPIGLGVNIITTNVSYKDSYNYGQNGTATGFGFQYEFATGLHYYYTAHHQALLTFRYGGVGGYVGLGYAYKF